MLHAPICSKVFEKLVFGAFRGFKPNDPCVNQPISITNSIFNAFDANPSLKVLSVFLGLLKAFDRGGHKGLLCNIKNNGINGILLYLMESFLHNRRQRVVLNSQSSNWCSARLCIRTLIFSRLYQ